MCIVGHPILDIISQLEAPSEFVSGDRTHICMSFVMELNTKEVLEDILIGDCIVGRTEAVG